MSKLTPTAEQSAIIQAAKTTKDNLLINALAGAAKTSTLVMICEAMPVQPILSLAFNKKIAVEMEKRLPGHVTSKTLNSIGHTVWSRAVPKRLNVNAGKTFELLKVYSEGLPKAERRAFSTQFKDILSAVRSAKMHGYIPEGKFTHAAPLVTRDEWLSTFEEDPDHDIIETAEIILARSIAAAYEGSIDFDDQIYMPTLFGGTFPRFPLVLVDEAQDLSPLNHAMLRKLVTSRLIAVGDPYQSIYAFRGAMTSSMKVLEETFAMRSMDLSVTFRCPKAIVRRAWTRVPSMRWAEWAAEGEVTELETWNAKIIPDGSAIICRNNAPLFRTALDLLRAGRGVQLVGADIGPGLLKILKGLGPETMEQERVLVEIDKWEAAALRKNRAKASTADRAECLRVFASNGDNLSAAVAYAEHLFKSTGPVQLLSIHKSKGLEYEVVYLLDEWRIPSSYAETPEELEQEENLRYVAVTRAKQSLFLIDRKGFQS